MGVLTLEQLERICPSTPPGRLALFVEPLNAVFEECSVNTPEQRGAFLAQYAHETEGFTRLEENLRYTTAAALIAATKPRWDALDEDDAWGYLNQPERLANRVYGNRNGNGDEASGDGWRFRGGGLPHLTFRDNYAMASRYLGLDLLANPELVRVDPGIACRVGGWFWQHIGGNGLVGDFHSLTVRLNGGTNGMDSRLAYLKRAGAALA